MNEDLKKTVGKDPDGLLTYEYIANHIGEIDGVLDELVDNMIGADLNGQFLVSAAHYLHAIDGDKYHQAIDRLIAAAIDRDRERRYIGDLLPALWGEDYAEHVAELSASDNNFRRIYKRLFPETII
ncbi:hypothetical protein [uncultured Muribaculum sp.]|uniref:hypothetical protein n=1 Tax=uncultured Muribaculum sp. TaxID=1918613 RepID=UPI0025EC8077|nr:hypothetical protein [uncultured Muribaculum sp.]